MLVSPYEQKQSQDPPGPPPTLLEDLEDLDICIITEDLEDEDIWILTEDLAYLDIWTFTEDLEDLNIWILTIFVWAGLQALAKSRFPAQIGVG